MAHGEFVAEYVIQGIVYGAVFHVATWFMCYGVRMLGSALGEREA